MNCLNDVRIQAVADNEAPASDVEHATTCERCGSLVRQRETEMTSLASAISSMPSMPPEVGRRVELAIAGGARAGATRLTDAQPSRRLLHPAVWSGGAVVAATLVAILVVIPMLTGPATLSASEVLARSAVQLASRTTSGVEFLEYELTLDGVSRELMPDHVNGAYRVRQVIDHDTPGRYFLATYGPDGSLLSAVSQDPVNHRRAMVLRVEDRMFQFDVALPAGMTLSPPEMERLHMEASVRLMQASGDQQLQVVDRGGETHYMIEVPKISAQVQNDVWDLAEARVLVDASDYHVVEFDVKGTFLKQPYSVSYRLISRTVSAQASVQPGEFDLRAEGSAIRIAGDGSAIPARDALVLALRELSRVKQAQQ
jgi:hypothetical protein